MREMAQFEEFGQCAICNQPSFHIPFIYSELKNVEKSSYWVEKITKIAFGSDECGFPGDEDNGTMACWYIFSMLGLYPFCPGKPEFVLTKPLVGAKIKLFNGNILTIEKGRIRDNVNKVDYFGLLGGGKIYDIEKTKK